MELKVKKINQDAVLPAYAHEGDAGLDICSVQDLVLAPGECKLVKTGLVIELPENTEAQIRPRSGLALKYQVTLLNTPGTIDYGYRGEVGIIMKNFGAGDFVIRKGMKIAQMVIKPVLRVRVREVDQLSDTERGSGGFGSTGQ